MTIDDRLIFWLMIIAFGLLLLRNPRCNRGCKSVAEHLLTHGLDEFLGPLIG